MVRALLSPVLNSSETQRSNQRRSVQPSGEDLRRGGICFRDVEPDTSEQFVILPEQQLVPFMRQAISATKGLNAETLVFLGRAPRCRNEPTKTVIPSRY